MLTRLRRLPATLLDAFYPPFCPHCGEKLAESHHLLCAQCVNLLDLLEPQKRCLRCFEERPLLRSGICRICRLQPHAMRRVAASFELFGPATTLVKQFKRTQQPQRAEGVAAFIVLQLLRLKWPIPDYIVPVPYAPSKRLLRGGNPIQQLAGQVARMLCCPTQQALKRREGDLPQKGRSVSQRRALSEESFHLRRSARIEDRTILLVDDIQSTGATLNACAQALAKGFPAAIYGLTICKQGNPGSM